MRVVERDTAHYGPVYRDLIDMMLSLIQDTFRMYQALAQRSLALLDGGEGPAPSAMPYGSPRGGPWQPDLTMCVTGNVAPAPDYPVKYQVDRVQSPTHNAFQPATRPLSSRAKPGSPSRLPALRPACVVDPQEAQAVLLHRTDSAALPSLHSRARQRSPGREASPPCVEGPGLPVLLHDVDINDGALGSFDGCAPGNGRGRRMLGHTDAFLGKFFLEIFRKILEIFRTFRKKIQKFPKKNVKKFSGKNRMKTFRKIQIKPRRHAD